MKTRIVTAFSMIIMLLFLTACGKNEIEGAYNWQIGEFTFTDQDNKAFGLADLEGKVWVADFIFTNCETVCLPMTFNMAKLQNMAKEEGIENLEFVSFSVDPELDSPAVLKEYGKQNKADLKNWHFLTGYTQQEIEKFALDNFKTLVKKPQNDDQVIHGTNLYLVNQDGKVMKDYSGLSDIPFEEIIKDIKTLQ